MKKEQILVNCCFSCEKGFYSKSNLNGHFKSKSHNETKIKLNKQKVKQHFYEFDDKDFVGIKSFYAKKEEHNSYYGDFDYSIIAIHNDKERVFADYELTKEGVEELKV